jgi:hypothetical protein
VETNDNVAYDTEPIKGTVNPAFNPTVDPEDRQATLGGSGLF